MVRDRTQFTVRLAVISQPAEAAREAIPDLQDELDHRPHLQNPRASWDAQHGHILIEIMEEGIDGDVAANVYAEEVVEIMAVVLGEFETVRVDIVS